MVGRLFVDRAPEQTAIAFLHWAHDAGIASTTELRTPVPALPPLTLRAITSFDVEERFLAHGMADAACILQVFARVAPRPLKSRMRFLDFGCGCGRLTRYVGMIDSADTSGCDVNTDLVGWCKENLRTVSTAANGIEPPLPFDDAFFDVVYAVSVFSHLSSEIAERWIGDLARILTPGGILVITTHGYSSLLIAKTSAPHQALLNLDETTTNRAMEELLRDHFVFRPYGVDVVKRAKVGSIYGNAFVDREYVRSMWNRPTLHFVEHIPGGLRGFQDIIVLQRT